MLVWGLNLSVWLILHNYRSARGREMVCRETNIRKLEQARSVSITVKLSWHSLCCLFSLDEVLVLKWKISSLYILLDCHPLIFSYDLLLFQVFNSRWLFHFLWVMLKQLNSMHKRKVRHNLLERCNMPITTRGLISKDAEYTCCYVCMPFRCFVRHCPRCFLNRFLSD